MDTGNLHLSACPAQGAAVALLLLPLKLLNRAQSIFKQQNLLLVLNAQIRANQHLPLAFYSEQNTTGTLPVHRLLKGEWLQHPHRSHTKPSPHSSVHYLYLLILGWIEVSSQLQHGFNSPFSFLVNCWELSLTQMELQLHVFTAQQAPNVTEDSTQTYLYVYSFGK